MNIKGKIRYSLNPTPGDNTSWWVVVDCDCAEFCKYYRYLYSLSRYRCSKLSKPSWGEHVTVNYGEEPLDKSAWGRYNGRTVELTASIVAGTANAVYWFPILNSEFLSSIRQELGLPLAPFNPFHICLGYDDDNRI